ARHIASRQRNCLTRYLNTTDSNSTIGQESCEESNTAIQIKSFVTLLGFQATDNCIRQGFSSPRMHLPKPTSADLPP
ncbi:hypothetical protein, partial [Enterococcus lactis]